MFLAVLMWFIDNMVRSPHFWATLCSHQRVAESSSAVVLS